jgi:hypothetical protein
MYGIIGCMEKKRITKTGAMMACKMIACKLWWLLKEV